MANANKLGICMDHSNAILIEYTIDPIETRTLVSDFSHVVRTEAVDKNESLMHNLDHKGQANFYNQLGAIIKNYQKVILFGPTDAKVELFNVLRADQQFEKIEVKVHHSAWMTETQQHAFVKDYFNAG